MADDTVAARPYAQAAFDLAREAGQLDPWAKVLALGAELVATPEVARVLVSPGANLDQLALVLADICREQTGVPAPVNFFRVLADNRRLGLLPHIAARFVALKAEAEQVLDVTLTSAQPVGDAEQGRLAEALRKRFGREIRLAVAVDPQLIGGARLQVGDRVIDGSVRTGLDKLATALRA